MQPAAKRFVVHFERKIMPFVIQNQQKQPFKYLEFRIDIVRK